METVTRQQKRTNPSHAGHRNAAEAQFKQVLDRIAPPPPPNNNNFQFKLNSLEDAA